MTTTLQQRVLDLLTAVAEARAPCPTNAEVAAEMGLGDDRSGSEMICALERRGRILVERRSNGRRIAIVASGRWTAWRFGHADQRGYREVDDGYRGPVPEHLRVDRDACPRCGVRRDHGCGHRSSRLGMEMSL